MRIIATLCVAVLLPVLATAEEKVDLYTIHRIKAEAFENSKVMDHAFYLTDVHGPRLTNTPAFTAAAEWARKRMEEFGLVNAKLEPWGPYGRGWSYSKFSASLLVPQYSPLIGFPLAWSASTNGPVAGEPVFAPMRNELDFQKFRGKLKGKIVLVDAKRDLVPATTAPSKRYSDVDLVEQGMAPDPAAPPPSRPTLPGAPATAAEITRFRNKLRQFLIDEGVLVAVTAGRGDAGVVFGQFASTREKKDAIAVPSVVLAPEHYNRIARLIEHKVPVKVEFDIKSTVHEDTAESVNVVAEIPGTRKKDELVILGAHLDSWHGGTGATDNAAGVAVVMEAARILKAMDAKLDRTVRIALWSGEENGLLGSKAYVKQHYADPEVMKPTAEHAKVSAYFNLDNGTGKIRGIYIQGNDMVRPVFESWLAPFRDLGATTVTIRNTGSTDHRSFDAVGIPAFQFVQDQVEYSSRTHHSNMDVYDRLQKGDLMQAAAVLASFAYHAANREEMIPRKPLPKPQPARKEGEEVKKPEDKPISEQKALTSAGSGQ